MDVLSSQKSDRMPLDSDSLAQSIARLESSISQAHQYVDDVVVSIRPQWCTRKSQGSCNTVLRLEMHMRW